MEANLHTNEMGGEWSLDWIYLIMQFFVLFFCFIYLFFDTEFFCETALAVLELYL